VLVFDSALDSASIECFLVDENTIRMDWFWSNLLGGSKLYVRKTDAETASSLLDQGVREKFEVEGVGAAPLPELPVTRSFLSGVELASGLCPRPPWWSSAASS